MSAPLEAFLRYINSGMQDLTPEMYDSFGGEAILDAVRQYDPDAHFVDTKITSGGEAGGDGIDGKRLVYDVTKMPKSKFGNASLDLRSSDHFPKMRNPSAHGVDDLYGDVTNSANLVKPADPTWTKIAPLAVSLAAPMAGAALAGAGIGGAGITAAATGSGLGGAASIPSWAAQLVTKAPQYAQMLANGGKFDPMAFLMALGKQGAGMAGVPSWMITAGQVLANEAKNKGR